MTENSQPDTPLPPPLDLIAYAQNGEDVVLYRTFKNVTRGFYVDVGSGDPTEGSVTKNLIDRLSWRGIDIEPQLPLCEALRRERPRSLVIDCAVGIKKEERAFYRLSDNWGMSTLDQSIANRHRESGWTVFEDVVSVMPLDEILEGRAVPGFELLKIDVEGSEAEVLASFSIKLWRPQVVVVEATLPATTEMAHEEWEHFLLEAGYRLCLFDGLNRFYVSGDAQHLTESLSIPANIFDRYIQLRWWKGLTEEARRFADPDSQFS
jgi:FkbM family methyltransferase